MSWRKYLARLAGGRRSWVAMLLVLLGGVTFGAAQASADAGNPILGTIKDTIKPDDPNNPSGGVTVYVRGQWNWLSHNSDCNFDRAATGVGIIWNDRNSPGFTVSNGSITAGVGVMSSTDGNLLDRMVHPVDLGNQVEGYTEGTWTSTAQGYTTNTTGDYPQGQAFADPSPPSPSSFGSWRGGCGREPLAATESKGTNPEATGLTCANGTTACSGHPWGSWGYEKNGGLGYSHHYASRADVTTVCANFYDVHGGGKFNSGKFQLVNGSKEITVNENGDNSIKTNKFNTNQGANCIKPPALTTVQTGQKVVISDFALVEGLVSGGNPPGTVTFKLYNESDPGGALCKADELIYTSPPITPDASKKARTPADGTASAPPHLPENSTSPQNNTWDWVVEFSGDNLNEPSSSPCGTEQIHLGGNTPGVDP